MKHVDTTGRHTELVMLTASPRIRPYSPCLRRRWVAHAKDGATVDKTQGGGLVKTLLLNAASLLHLTDRSTSFCIQCRGRGEIICPKCKGTTTHGVHSAGGLKTNRCLTCHGVGKCVCPQCQVRITPDGQSSPLGCVCTSQPDPILSSFSPALSLPSIRRARESALSGLTGGHDNPSTI